MSQDISNRSDSNALPGLAKKQAYRILPAVPVAELKRSHNLLVFEAGTAYTTLRRPEDKPAPQSAKIKD